jgi:hypothetical protein
MTECLVCFEEINNINPKTPFKCGCTKQPNICHKCYTSWELENSKAGKNTSCPNCRRKTTLIINNTILYGIEIDRGLLNLQLEITKPIPKGMLTPATKVIFEKNRHCYNLGLQKINITKQVKDGKNINRLEFTVINVMTESSIRINLDVIYKYIIHPRIFGKKDITIFSKDLNGEKNQSFIEGLTYGDNLIKELNKYIPTKKTVLKENSMSWEKSGTKEKCEINWDICQYERIEGDNPFQFDIL